MDVSSSGQITLIHAGTPECYYHGFPNYLEASKTILRAEATSTSNEGEGKAWTKYGSSLAQSVHYMTENDYNTILKNKNENESYYLWDYLEKNNTGTCYNNSQAECGKDYDLIDTGSYYWLASAGSANYLYDWYPNSRVVFATSSQSYGVRPVIKLKCNIKIASGAGSSTDPYKLVVDESMTSCPVGSYVTYTPTNATWDTSRDGVTTSIPSSQGKFGGIKSNEDKSKNVTCYTSSGYGTNKNEGWRIMNVSSSGQITLIHAGTPECYYQAYSTSGYSEASKIILRAEATSASNEGDGKAWTKYGSSLAQSIHYMTENDYNTILKNKNGNESYYLWDYLEKNDRGTCYGTTSSNCGQNYDLIDTGSYYYLAFAASISVMPYWHANSQNVNGGNTGSYGVRPVIVLKPNVIIGTDGNLKLK